MAEVIYTCTQTLWDVCALGYKSKKNNNILNDDSFQFCNVFLHETAF